MSEAKGPYKELGNWGDGSHSAIEGPGIEKMPQKVFFPLDLAELLNMAYDEGRASRDGLITAMKYAINQYQHPHKFAPESNHWCNVLANAIEADGEGE